MKMLLSFPENAGCLSALKLLPGYICSNNLCLGYRIDKKVAEDVCFPSFF